MPIDSHLVQNNLRVQSDRIPQLRGTVRNPGRFSVAMICDGGPKHVARLMYRQALEENYSIIPPDADPLR